jgi:3-mercaptopyruvate sulfurtransferase SseA
MSAQHQPRSRSTIQLAITLAGAVLLLVAILWIVDRRLGDSQTASAALTTDQIPRVTLAEARAAWDQGVAVFVDARTVDAYNSGHIPGAHSIPVNLVSASLSELEPNAWIITYCT